MNFLENKATATLLRLLLILIIVLAASLGPLANAFPVRAQSNNRPDAPFGRDLYLPTVSSDRKTTETLETDFVRLDQSAVQVQTTEKPDNESALNTDLPPASPAATTNYVPAVTDATVVLLQEEFDSNFPSGNWRVFDQDGTKNGEYFWDDDDFRALTGNASAWVANGGANGLDPASNNYPNNLQSWMIYGPVDLSDAANAFLMFSYWNRSEINYDFLGWYASPNGNDFYGLRVSGDSQGWKPVTLDLGNVPGYGNLRGDASVWIALRFISDGNITDTGAFVDQLRIQKDVNVGCAGEFKAEYFNNKELSGTPVFTRCEKAPINTNWGTGGPGNGIGNDNFSVRWTGSFSFDSAPYNFVATTDDGVRVWLDDRQILNNWQVQSLTPNLATRNVTAGQHTLRIEYFEAEGGATAQFRWLRSDTTYSNRQAFDTCFLPHPSEMERWWGESPYYEVGIYIGGSNRGCKAHNEQHLTGSWVATVQNQGWNLIPTWVGPQAPCTTHDFYKMSSNPEVAFVEGRTEAGNAAAAAQRLGLTTQDVGGTVIYYDMEPYPNEAGCREAVKSFMAGWASRLHELGNLAGGYGAACASYVTDWVLTPPYTIDQIWAAAWIYPAYNANASVWNVSCIDNSVWSNSQRIRQYAGDHNERWGGLTLNIASNIAGGQVAGSTPRISSTDTENTVPEVEAWRAVQVRDLQLLTVDTGWAVVDGALLWSMNGGTSWQNRTPTELPLEVSAAHFLDTNQGWLVGATSPDAQGRSQLYVGKSADGGLTWQMRALHEFDPIEPLSTQGTVQLSFFDANVGYVQIKLASSSNFDLHALLKTTDGGTSWQLVDVPGSSPVHFADALTGWTGASTGEMPTQLTTDGGASWHTADALPTIAANSATAAWDAAAADVGATATTFLADGTGWIFVERGVCDGSKPPADEAGLATDEAFGCVQSSALLRTTDGGHTWIDITPRVQK